MEKTGIELAEDMKEFIIKLNVVSVPTRYPSDLSKMSSGYNKAKTGEVLKMTIIPCSLSGTLILKWRKKRLKNCFLRA